MPSGWETIDKVIILEIESGLISGIVRDESMAPRGLQLEYQILYLYEKYISGLPSEFVCSFWWKRYESFRL